MADLKANKVQTDDDILAQHHNDVVDDLGALNDERPQKGEKGDTGERGPQGEQGPKGEDGTNGADGANGNKGDPGSDGADGVSVVGLSLTTDDNGAVTGGTVTFSDDSTADITVS